ncbi:hypothetical protein ONZ45_g10320 [Pleurotus djamor]|nr:hypothetical protein ONZ45_g10320 [Pleurotus djamor]
MLGLLTMPSKIFPQSPSPRSSRTPSSSNAPIHRLNWGIFEVAYAPPKRPCSGLLAASRSWLALYRSFPFAVKLVTELFHIAPFKFTAYTLSCIWTMVSAVLSLYMCSVALDLISIPTPCLEGLEAISSGPLATLAYSCIASTLVSTLMERVKKDASLDLRGELRSHFLPKLVNARLQTTDPIVVASLPSPWQFEEVAPGWDIVESLCFRLGSLSIVTIQHTILVLLYFRRQTLESKLLLLFCVYYPLSLCMMPCNGIGGAEYVFWTKNPFYRRLASLYTLIFSPDFEQDIRKAGISKLLSAEFSTTSAKLPTHRPDAVSLAANDIPRPLIWDLINSIVADLPVLAFISTLSWTTPTNAITKSLLLRLMTQLIRNNFDFCMGSSLSLSSICAQAEKFYGSLPNEDTFTNLQVDESSTPKKVTTAQGGMSVRLSNVNLFHGTPQRSLLRRLSLRVQPGQVVAIVGSNGSSKSVLLKLLSRMMDPSSGDILIDDEPIEASTLQSFREVVTVLSQSPQELYPVSLRENIAFGTTADVQRDSDLIDQAARLGGASDLLLRVGHDALPCAVPLLGQSMGVSPPAVVQARNAALASNRPVQLTREEVQRVLASRAIFRLLSRQCRLVLVDDALSELDPLSEMNVMKNIIQVSQGKTVVYVAHRLNQLITQADVIVCMEEGQVVEQGTHQELIRARGVYATLYSTTA